MTDPPRSAPQPTPRVMMRLMRRSRGATRQSGALDHRLGDADHPRADRAAFFTGRPANPRFVQRRNVDRALMVAYGVARVRIVASACGTTPTSCSASAA